MTRRTQLAACLPLSAALVLGIIQGEVSGAESFGGARYVLAPSDPTVAPSDPTMAPAEPRDMTSPRAMRRAARGRGRDRMAPEAPMAPLDPTDLTITPTMPARPGLRRFESTWLPNAPVEPLRDPTAQYRNSQKSTPPAAVGRTAPAAPAELPIATVADPVPAPTAPEAPAEAIQLTQGGTAPLPVAPPAPDENTPAVEAQRVSTLNKSLKDIGLVEAIDLEGMRPADVASELQPPQTPRIVTGSLFGLAHPPRYQYCFTHNPLYFQDSNLERCGIGHGVCQPAVSAAKFIGQTAILPYSLIAAPPCSCETTLGDCPTCHAYPWGTDFHN